MRTNKPISGKIFYTNDNNEIVNKIFQNLHVNVDISFDIQPNQPINKKIELFLFHSLSRRLLSSSNRKERILQSIDPVKLTVSNKPIIISTTGSSSEGVTTSTQYFLYIGVPIITLIVLSGVILTFVYILRKIKKLKKKSKNKNNDSIELNNQNVENKKFNSSNITRNNSEKNTKTEIIKLNISKNEQSNMPIMYVMPPQHPMIQPQMIPQQMNALSTMNMQNQLPYMIASPLSQMSHNQSNVNVFQLPSKFSNYYGINDNTHSNSAKNTNQIPNTSFKSSLTDNIHIARRKSEKENYVSGPILRKNTIRPARNEIEDEFVKSGFPLQPFVANNPFANNLRMDGATEMPNQGDLPLFEIQLEKINEYTPGEKFS